MAVAIGVAVAIRVAAATRVAVATRVAGTTAEVAAGVGRLGVDSRSSLTVVEGPHIR